MNLPGSDKNRMSNKNIVLVFFVFLYSLFIVYGTIIPLDFKDSAFALHKLRQYSFLPPSIYNKAIWVSLLPDILQNIIFFIPVGVFGGLLVEPRKPSAFVFYIVTLYGAMLSMSVEFIQLFSLTRNTSVIDVITNTGGTVCGLMMTKIIPYCRINECKTKQIIFSYKETYLFLLLMTVIIANALLPFDFSLVPDHSMPKLRAVLHNSNILTVSDWGEATWTMMLYTIITIAGINLWRVCRRTIRYLLILLLIIMPSALETLQLIIVSRIPDVNDVLCCYFGIVSGFLIWLFFNKKQSVLTSVIQVLFVICIICKFILFSGSVSEHRIMNSMPYISEFTRATMFYLGNFFETILIFGMCGFGLENISGDKKNKVVITLLSILIVACGDYLSGFMSKPHYVIAHIFVCMMALALGQIVYRKGMNVFIMIISCRFFGYVCKPAEIRPGE